jgi:predicted PurR-regulated permease PerM
MPPTRDLTRTTLAVLFIGALIVGIFWVLRPFLPATLWATMIVVSTWPLMLRIQGWLWNRRSLAVAAMILGLLLAVVVPILLAVHTVRSGADLVSYWADAVAHTNMSSPPDWIEGLPLIGAKVAEKWRDIASWGSEGLEKHLSPYVQQVGKWVLTQVGTLAVLLLQLGLVVIIATILYLRGEAAAQNVLRFVQRLAGARGESAARLAAQAIRSVALGIILTALAQSILAAIGLAITGIPNAPLLGVLAFVLCVAQLGPGFILVPAVIWLYWSGHTGAGTTLLVWSLPVVALDNFMRPILIRRGADLPLILIFVGVIGGLIAFGIIGLFVGPVILAVAYTLEASWAQEVVPEHEGVDARP